MDQQNLDFNYFLENIGKLYRKYGHKLVVIKNQNVLGAYDDLNKALKTTLKTEEMDTFLIQECFDCKDKMVFHFQGNVIPVPA